MICPKCNKKAPWVENKEKYGRNYGKSYMCYFCKPCDTYVGCHNNTRRALGTMADKETQQARQQAHEVFDPLWKTKEMTRKEAYQWLSEKMGKETHIAESSLYDCKRIIEILTT